MLDLGFVDVGEKLVGGVFEITPGYRSCVDVGAKPQLLGLVELVLVIQVATLADEQARIDRSRLRARGSDGCHRLR